MWKRRKEILHQSTMLREIMHEIAELKREWILIKSTITTNELANVVLGKMEQGKITRNQARELLGFPELNKEGMDEQPSIGNEIERCGEKGQVKRTALAKAVLIELSKQGLTVKEIDETCECVKKIARCQKVTESCVHSFKDWLD